MAVLRRGKDRSIQCGAAEETVTQMGKRQRWWSHSEPAPGHPDPGDLECVLLWPPASTSWVPRSPMRALKPVLCGAGMEPRASCMLGRHSASYIPSPLRRFQTLVYKAPQSKHLSTNEHIET